MKLTSKPKKTGFRARLGKTLLATTLAASLVLSTFPATPAHAEDVYTSFSPDSLTSGQMIINLNSLKGPAIKMNSTLGGTYNYGSTSNAFRMIQGQAIEKDQSKRPKEPVDPQTKPNWSRLSPEDQRELKEEYEVKHRNWEGDMDVYWKTLSTWTEITSTLSPSDPIDGSVTGFNQWQKPGHNYKSFWLFDSTPAPTVQKNHDDFTIKGKVQGNPNLDLEVVYETLDREIPNPADLTGEMTKKTDRATYLVKVTNTSQTEAQVFGLSWNVDTMIINDDSAPFRGPGVNLFGTESIEAGFPTKWADQFSGNDWTTKANALTRTIGAFTVHGFFPDNINSYKEKVPEFMYATSQNGGRTAIIYPKAQGSRKYPSVSQDQAAEAHFENPDYFGIGHFLQIATTSTDENDTNYWWHKINGNGGSSNDSGHMARYNPRVILPGETKYFGVTYGEADVDEGNPNGPYLKVNNPTTVVNVDDQNKYSPVTLDLLYGNSSANDLTDAVIKMYLPVNYLVAEDSMINDNPGTAVQWVKENNPVTKYIDGKQVACYVWKRPLGTVPAHQPDKSVNNIVILDAIEQTGARNDGQKLKPNDANPTSVTPVYAFELEYKMNGSDLAVPDHSLTTNTPAGATFQNEYQYTHKNVPVRLPFVNPVTLNADIWRDIDGDGTKGTGEGLVGKLAQINPKDDDRNDEFTSIGGGLFKFLPQGYGKTRDRDYVVSFTDIPKNATAEEKAKILKNREKYTWVLDGSYNGSKINADPNKNKGGIFYTFNNPDRTNYTDVLDEGLAFTVDPTTDYPSLTFKVKSGTSDVINLDLRLREYLAGKLSIKPFVDQGENNHSYEKTVDKLVPNGKYRLRDLDASGHAKTDMALNAGPDLSLIHI